MGLVKSERKEKQIKLSRTDLGEIIYMTNKSISCGFGIPIKDIA